MAVDSLTHLSPSFIHRISISVSLSCQNAAVLKDAKKRGVQVAPAAIICTGYDTCTVRHSASPIDEMDSPRVALVHCILLWPQAAGKKINGCECFFFVRAVTQRSWTRCGRFSLAVRCRLRFGEALPRGGEGRGLRGPRAAGTPSNPRPFTLLSSPLLQRSGRLGP